MLKKVLKSALVFAIMTAGTFQTYASNKVVVDQVAAVVGNSVILLSDLESTAQMVREHYRNQGITSDRDPMEEALENLMNQKMLYNQAIIDSVPVNLAGIAMGVEQMLDKEVELRGSVKAVEEYYNKPVFAVKEEIRTKYTESQYAQAMQQTIESQVSITPGEVERFYKKLDKEDLPIVPEQYVFAQIVKYPPSTEDAKFRARQNLLEMRERIINGTRFDVLARMYSVDGSAVRGGEMDPTAKDGFVKPFADALGKLSIGQVSGVVETEYGFHLIELLEKLPGEMYRCRHILLRPIFTNEEITEAIDMLDSVRMDIVKEGSILSFEKAAARYSEDKYSKENGGIVTNFEMLEMYNAMDAKLATTRFMKEDLGRDNFNTISSLKEGEVSKPFRSEDLRGNELVKIIKLIEIVPSHPANLEHDYIRIEALALQEKRDKVFNEFLEKKVEGMYVRIDDRFKGAKFENDFWFK